MEAIRTANVPIFVVTLEVAIAVISLVPLSVVFVFFGLASLGHDGPEPFYPEEIRPAVLIASAISCGTVYVLQVVQLATGVLVLQSMTLIKVNFRGAVRASWVWLCCSLGTVGVLVWAIYRVAGGFGSNRFLIGFLSLYLVEKVVTIPFVVLYTADWFASQIGLRRGVRI